NAPNGSFFLLHACAHNPTGVDPSEEQWKEISKKIKEKGHFLSLTWHIKVLLVVTRREMRKPSGFFLRMAIYLELPNHMPKIWDFMARDVLCEDQKQAVAVKSQLQMLARPMYSNPPVHGALIVSTILGDPDLKKLWLKEVKGMADRIIGMRTALRENLEKLGSPLSWEHITNQIGMFCYSGMTPEQVDRLTNEFHIYMTRNGRISMAGVTTGNVGYLANAIHEVTKSA
ncbi:aspartate aminotransferase 1, partial [Prunus dulcis]